MEFTTFVRRPFNVEAVQVTDDNIEEVAEHVGRVKTNPNGVRYIAVNDKKVPHIRRVGIGYWMTIVSGHARCYTDEIFHREFIRACDTIVDSVEALSVTPDAQVEELPQPESDEILVVDHNVIGNTDQPEGVVALNEAPVSEDEELPEDVLTTD